PPQEPGPSATWFSQIHSAAEAAYPNPLCANDRQSEALKAPADVPVMMSGVNGLKPVAGESPRASAFNTPTSKAASAAPPESTTAVLMCLLRSPPYGVLRTRIAAFAILDSEHVQRGQCVRCQTDDGIVRHETANAAETSLTGAQTPEAAKPKGCVTG